MTPTLFEAADHDGTFCIRFTTTDYCNPSIVTHYWPTLVQTRDVLRFFFDDGDAAEKLALIHVKQSRPGEYYIGIKEDYFGAPWKAGQHVLLTNGGATQPIHTVTREAPPPKLRKGTQCYWSGGNWFKRTKTGKPETINPLTV